MNTTKPELPELTAALEAAERWAELAAMDAKNRGAGGPGMESDVDGACDHCHASIRALSAIALASKDRGDLHAAIMDLRVTVPFTEDRREINAFARGVTDMRNAVLDLIEATPAAPVLAAEAASVEKLAEVIYNSMTGSKAWPWQPGGNSDKQCEARIYADAVHAHVSALANSKTEAAIGEVTIFDSVNDVEWYGEIPKHGTKLYAAPAAPIDVAASVSAVDKMLEMNQLDELGHEVARLQTALCFWLPSVTDREDEVADRILQDAFLLCGIDGNIPDDFKTAQELGWVTLASHSAAAPATPSDVGLRITILEDALRWYAAGHHFERHDLSAWDTVSGEPMNFFEDERNTATVEDGSVAKLALAGTPVSYTDDAASQATQPEAAPKESEVKKPTGGQAAPDGIAAPIATTAGSPATNGASHSDDAVVAQDADAPEDERRAKLVALWSVQHADRYLLEREVLALRDQVAAKAQPAPSEQGWPEMEAAIEAMGRAKRLKCWDGIPHALHVELDAVFAALVAALLKVAT